MRLAHNIVGELPPPYFLKAMLWNIFPDVCVCVVIECIKQRVFGWILVAHACEYSTIFFFFKCTCVNNCHVVVMD